MATASRSLATALQGRARSRLALPSYTTSWDVTSDRSGASARTICWCSTLSTFGESSRNTRPITMRFEPTFRSVRMRPADGPSNGSGTLSLIQSLADYTIAMLDLLEMLRALTLYPWLNTAEDE